MKIPTRSRTSDGEKQRSIPYCLNFCKGCFNEIPIADGSPAYRENQRIHRVLCDTCAGKIRDAKIADLTEDGWFTPAGLINRVKLVQYRRRKREEARGEHRAA